MTFFKQEKVFCVYAKKLDKEGWDENFIYKLRVIAELSQFLSTFEFFNDTDFNLQDEEIIKSNVFSL